MKRFTLTALILFFVLLIASSVWYFLRTKVVICGISGPFAAKSAPYICRYLYLDSIIFGLWISCLGILVLFVGRYVLRRIKKK